MKHMASQPVTMNSLSVILGGEGRSKSLTVMHKLLDSHAVVAHMGGHFHQKECISQQAGSVLIPLSQAVQRLTSAKTITEELGSEIEIFACTDARTAVAVVSDSDRSDHKYMSGLIAWDGNHAYCGGLDPCISRALTYASYADVVGFKSNEPSLSEAQKFASSIRAKFPEKRLAFGYVPKADGQKWNEANHIEFELELKNLGYDYYFFMQFGSPVFVHFGSATSWVMFDDIQREALLKH